MDKFCQEAFWDLDKTWNNEMPDISSCFGDIVLISFPNFVFCITLLISIWYVPTLRTPLPWAWVITSKLVLSASCLLVSCVWCGILLRDIFLGENIAPSTLASSCSRVAVFIIVTMTLLMHRSRGVTTSTTLSIFWLLQGVFGVILHRSAILKYFSVSTKLEEEVIFICNILYYFMVYMLAVLSVFADEKDFKSLNEENVIDDVTLLSFISFSWFNRLICKAKQKILTVSDLAFLNVKYTTGYVSKAFYHQWEMSLSKESPSLIWALLKAFWPWITAGIILDFLFVVLLFLPPLLLDCIIHFVHDDHYSWRGYFYSSIIFLVLFIAKIMQNCSVFLLTSSGAQFKSALMNAIYRKNLWLAPASRKMYSSGTLLSLLSVDVERIEEFSLHCTCLISSPIQILVIIFIMWQYIGSSCVAGVGVILILIPICLYASRINETFSEKQMEMKDFRLRQLNDILSGIKILKLYAWELPFAAKVSDARKSELKLVCYSQLCQVAIVFVFFCAPFMVSLASFSTYLFVDENHVLSPTKVFVTLTLMDQLRYALFEIPDALSELIQCGISLERIRKFLVSENTTPGVIGNNTEKGDVLKIKNATFSWCLGCNPLLLDIDLNIRKGSLVAIIGPVASGKSSLLSAVLGEMHKTHGTIDIKGSIAYVPQQAWILNRNLKDNVLLVEPMNRRKYRKILDCCCLLPDLEVLPARDETEIGEKGINLSGGQKQRISLARAVYQDKDIYLLDDPLSAVDAHVRKALFEDVISNKGILQKKTRILVTHDVSILNKVDLIVFMKQGRIDEIGSCYELMRRGGSVRSLIREYTKIPQEEKLKTNANENAGFTSKVNGVLRERTISEENKAIQNVWQIRRTSTEGFHSKEGPSRGKRLTEDETMETGGVNCQIYWEYIRNTGLLLLFTVTFWYIAAVSFETGANVWLSDWSAEAINNKTRSSETTLRRLTFYGMLGLSQALSMVFASTLLVYGTRKASEIYHTKMLGSIIRSPMSFFDATPLGRIMNRFSTDMDVMDVHIYPVADGWFQCLLESCASFLVIGLNTPLFLILILPIGVVYFLLQRQHLRTFRQTMRLESTTRSPIYSHFLESIQGASSICAYNVQDEFIKGFEEKLNNHMLCCFSTASCTRWLHFWLDSLGCVIVLMATVLAVENRDSLGPAVIGLMITYALSITESLMWFVRLNTELENKSISIERLDEYCKLKPEAPWNLVHDSFQDRWPKYGSLVFKNYSAQYSEELDPVLKNINFYVQGNEKVGIVGRTGAGKSSLALALFRIIEPLDGTIYIDNIDITTLGLHCLRSKLTIIPQDPVLFVGSLRMNLDPRNEYRDEEILESLQRAHLKTFVDSLADGLGYNLEEGGVNLSVGQKQLLCLARALLKKTKILVLDEATASVDLDTDSLIQDTIRKAFSNHTVITIAHRLNTIIDYDKVVVMENGSIVEIGIPTKLLKDTESKFYQLTKDSGLM